MRAFHLWRRMLRLHRSRTAKNDPPTTKKT
jgi:hypothetical protein